MAEVRDAIVDVLREQRPMTVRQVFYQLVSRGAIAKTEAEYKQTVVRLLGDMRRERVIPFGWIADNTRWMRKPRTHRDLTSALEHTRRFYRRSLWNDQDAYVEVWLEKDALAGVVYAVTAGWDVPLMVTRGYPSLTFLAEAADALAEQGRRSHLYYLGDHDPSGVDIPRHVEGELRQLIPSVAVDGSGPGRPFTFEVIAVTSEQITTWNLPTRPTKATDTRAARFDGESVEVDAIPPDRLRELVENAITQHIDRDVLTRTEEIEQAERDSLAAIIDRLPREAG